MVLRTTGEPREHKSLHYPQTWALSVGDQCWNVHEPSYASGKQLQEQQQNRRYVLHLRLEEQQQEIEKLKNEVACFRQQLEAAREQLVLKESETQSEGTASSLQQLEAFRNENARLKKIVQDQSESEKRLQKFKKMLTIDQNGVRKMRAARCSQRGMGS